MEAHESRVQRFNTLKLREVHLADVLDLLYSVAEVRVGKGNTASVVTLRFMGNRFTLEIQSQDFRMRDFSVWGTGFVTGSDGTALNSSADEVVALRRLFMQGVDSETASDLDRFGMGEVIFRLKQKEVSVTVAKRVRLHGDVVTSTTQPGDMFHKAYETIIGVGNSGVDHPSQVNAAVYLAFALGESVGIRVEDIDLVEANNPHTVGGGLKISQKGLPLGLQFRWTGNEYVVQRGIGYGEMRVSIPELFSTGYKYLEGATGSYEVVREPNSTVAGVRGTTRLTLSRR